MVDCTKALSSFMQTVSNPGAALGSHDPGDRSLPAPMQKSRALLQAVPTMDIEHINQIGNLIADLSAYRRAKGYL